MKAALENENQTEHGSEDILLADSPTLLVRGLVHSSNKSSGSAPESDVTGTLAVMVRLQAPPQALVCVADPTLEARLAEALEERTLFEANIIADEVNAHAAMRTQLRKLVITDSLHLIRRLRALDFKGYLHILFVGSSSSEIAALGRGADDCFSPQTSNAALVARLRGFRRICDLEVALHSALVQNKQLSTTDELTGLANRHFFATHWPRELERAARNKGSVAVAMCDIDHFKRINDTHGHAIGDLVLREFSVRVQQSLRRGKDWVARLGGEEFAIVLSGVSAAQAINIVEGIRASIRSRPFDSPTTNVPITASFGLCIADSTKASDVATCQRLLSIADKALYKSKHGGRDRVTAARAKP
jgi:diguanylate cyclase (GGDEF)-like protein